NTRVARGYLGYEDTCVATDIKHTDAFECLYGIRNKKSGVQAIAPAKLWRPLAATVAYSTNQIAGRYAIQSGIETHLLRNRDTAFFIQTAYRYVRERSRHSNGYSRNVPPHFSLNCRMPLSAGVRGGFATPARSYVRSSSLCP